MCKLYKVKIELNWLKELKKKRILTNPGFCESNESFLETIIDTQTYELLWNITKISVNPSIFFSFGTGCVYLYIFGGKLAQQSPLELFENVCKSCPITPILCFNGA